MKNLLILFLPGSSIQVNAQTLIRRDPETESMVKEVPADFLRRYFQQQGSFGSRKTLRTQTNATRGSGAAGKPGGYYVLMRETTSPVWQRTIYTTETAIRLPYAKDNYCFAIQALHENGNESLPVVPLPARQTAIHPFLFPVRQELNLFLSILFRYLSKYTTIRV